jgi:hypothetical protein
MTLSDNRLKYESFYKGEYESRNRNRNPCRSRFITKSVPFFWKPYLKIGNELQPHHIQITVGSGRKTDGTLVDTEIFKGIIWTLDITNKHPRKKIHVSRTASNCFPFIYIENIAHRLSLRWKQYLQEPTECITHTTIPDGEIARNEYHRILGYHYIQDFLLEKTGITDIDIQVGETHKLYLIFTFEGSNFAYLIVPREYPTWYGERQVFYSNIDGVFLFIPMIGDRELSIKFESKEHKEITWRKLKIRVNSWDNVTLVSADKNSAQLSNES